MTLSPRDRRGLGEIIAWSSAMVAMAIVTTAYLARGLEPPHAVVGALCALVMLVVARGTDSAAQRSGSVEQRNLESAEMRAARERINLMIDQHQQAIVRLELLAGRMFDSLIDSRLPALPPTNLTTRKKDNE